MYVCMYICIYVYIYTYVFALVLSNTNYIKNFVGKKKKCSNVMLTENSECNANLPLGLNKADKNYETKPNFCLRVYSIS